MSSPDRSEPAGSERPRRGLVLFPPGTPAASRRAKLAFAALAAVAGAALVWPVYPRFASPFPQILGLPLSLAWVVGWLTAVFVGLVLLYRHQHGDGRDRRGDADAGGGGRR